LKTSKQHYTKTEFEKMRDGVTFYMLQNLTGYIYFIQMDRIGPIKIGITKDLAQRLYQLGSANPYPLRLLAFLPGNEDTEREIHDNFAVLRLEGEWFLPHPLLLKTIDKIKKYCLEDGIDDPDPEVDLGDFSCESEAWERPRIKIVTDCPDRECEIIKSRTTRLCEKRGCKRLKREQIKAVL